MIKNCPICNQLIASNGFYYQKECPVLNNVLYGSIAESMIAPTGELNIKQCKKCGFIFNANYSPDLISYQKGYNSSRSNSRAYNNYVTSLIRTIKERIIVNSEVLEIGCGDGSFLKELSDTTRCSCWGYDPSCKGPKINSNNVKFIDDYFCPETNKRQFDVLIFRHILEHIWEPYQFLSKIVKRNVLKNNALIVVEVPDHEWIITNLSFFDFTYEHCNYFNYSSLHYLLSRLNIQTIERKSVFKNQYILVFGVWSQNNQLNGLKNNNIIINNFRQRVEKKKKKIIQIVKSAEVVCIWGASGKGVIFLSNFQKEVAEKINFVVDIDPLKHGKFLPVSGKKVLHPESLNGNKKVVTVFVMNNIYKDEIQVILDKMNIKSQLIIV